MTSSQERPASITASARLCALEELKILDTPPEAGFDDIVHLATSLCEVSVALVSLVAKDRQWFKAKVGFGPDQTDLDKFDLRARARRTRLAHNPGPSS